MSRILIALALLLATVTANAVTIRTDPAPAGLGITHCGYYVGPTLATVVLVGDVPLAEVGGGPGCLFVIDAQAPGSTAVYVASFVRPDPVWGREEGPRSLPLSVPRPPALSARPTWATNPVQAQGVTIIQSAPLSRPGSATSTGVTGR